ncbi:hypothetical protein HYH02_002287 [Chlamydomonas schloesseri]|uniref:Uncharacterized protein n=1 Tax=Chlamydomonas schloesseri TaxID=2026947 RepID=A0A835WSL9_9CHLO|nr:hypothetical protein HYH02_002287 [Chlamydomonas schloesseri]|eukprot:KAG2452950.1 hypothetical protein HYH02_002287 [Chlamydomonas schloesseri]
MDANLDIRTLNVLGGPYNETYSVSPDVPGHPHTIRHALTPIYTYEALGAVNATFSWMLLGDDDTVWSLPAVLRLVNERRLNAEEPHMLGDFQYHCVREHFECIAPVAGMLKLLARDPHFYLPLALDTVVPEAASGDVALAEGVRLLGYGFTNLLPSEEAARVAAGSPKQNITRRFFAPHCLFNDGRSPDEHLRVLKDQAAKAPAAFRTMVSVHARQRILFTRYHDLVREVLPAYRGIVALLLSMEGEDGGG